jgi:hypothetical protein
MVTTREPGDLPFENRAFPGGVLRQRLQSSLQDGLAFLFRTPT